MFFCIRPFLFFSVLIFFSFQFLLAQSSDVLGEKNLYERMTIKKIIIKNNHSINDFVIKNFLEFKENETFVKEKLKNSFKKIYASQFFEDIQFAIEIIDDNAINIIIIVKEYPTIDKIKFVGNQSFSKTDLLSSVEESFPQFQDTVFYSKTLIQSVKNFLLDKYVEEGFLLAKIKSRYRNCFR